MKALEALKQLKDLTEFLTRIDFVPTELREEVKQLLIKAYQDSNGLFTIIEKALKRNESKVYLFHGTNAKMLDYCLVRGTFFTDDLEIALKYGKTIYAVELDKQSYKWFKRTDEGHYQCLGSIPLSYCIKLDWSDEK